MHKKSRILTSTELSDVMVNGMQEKKAKNIVILDLRDVKNSVADYFVICSGTSDSHIDAISDSVEGFVFKKDQQNPWKIEGKENLEWVVLDYVDVVAHIFQEDKRDYFSLEELWGDAKINRIESEADDEKYAVKF